jgi:hypothetical protein
MDHLDHPDRSGLMSPTHTHKLFSIVLSHILHSSMLETGTQKQTCGSGRGTSAPARSSLVCPPGHLVCWLLLLVVAVVDASATKNDSPVYL